MISLYEASNLLATIRAHHGDAQFGEEDVRMFHAELDRSVTVGEARAAIVEYYSQPRDRWCGPGDLNRIVRQRRAALRPSEAQIGRELEELARSEGREIGSDRAWLYRRERMRLTPPREAARVALTARNPLALPAKPKPKRRGFSLRDVIGVDPTRQADCGEVKS